MKPVNFYYFFYDDERNKRRRTNWRMTIEESRQWLKNPEPDLASIEVRMVPESEMEHQHTSSLAGPGQITPDQRP